MNTMLVRATDANYGHRNKLSIWRITETGHPVSSPESFCDGFLHQVGLAALPEEAILLSSDRDEDYWRCIQELDEHWNQVLQMKCLDNGVTWENSEFLSTDSERDSESSGTSSSTDYVQSEEESDTETEERNTKRVLQSRLRKGTIEFGARGRSKEKTLKQVVVVIMDTSSEHEDVLQPRLGTQKQTARTQRQTRLSSKLLKQGSAQEKGEGSQSKVGRGKNSTLKESSALKKNKKGTQVSPAVVNAVFGNLQNCVANATELRRKRDEDTLKCGRIPRMVGDASKTTSSRTEMASELEDTPLLKEKDGDQVLQCAHSEGNKNPNQLSPGLQQIPTQVRKQGPPLTTDEENCSIASEFPHEAIGLNVQQEIAPMKATCGSNSRHMLEMRIRKEKDVHPFYRNQQQHSGSPGITQRNPSAVVLHNKNHDNMSRKVKEVFPMEGPRGRRQWSPDVYKTSRGHRSVQGDDRFTRRPLQLSSCSPPYEEGRSLHRRQWDHDMYKSRSPIYQRSRPGAGEKSWEEGNGSGRHCSRDSSSSDSRYQDRRSASPHHGHSMRRGSPSSRRSTSPRTSLLCTNAHVGGASNNRLQKRRIEDVVTSSASVDRRTRRQKQSARECQRLQRETEGKKPFYLTVDIEGRPYGPGRQAWIADINKLAAGLDPSCTDIRKQAHGDICIFKDRLNEHFEYSADVSEHYLRGFIGKAVTRRRTDLIAFINKNGSRPANFDENIWKRLEMLATSEQREKRTKHGRYANACRRTLGRTGALGEEGIRERLHQLLGRSPDPDEVNQEMQRDKGYGKLKVKTAGEWKKQDHKHSDDVLHEDGMKFQPFCSQFQHYQTDDDESTQEQSELERTHQQNKDAAVVKHAKELEGIRGGSDVLCGSGGRDITEKYSKDHYIAQLEAELKSLKEGIVGKSF